MLLALRIEVDHLAALRTLPALAALLQEHGADASFFVSLGPDRSGLRSQPVFGVGSHRQQQRLNRRLAGPHGLARFYGRGLPAPELGKRGIDAIKVLQQIGYELGMGAGDAAGWIRDLPTQAQDWAEQVLKRSHYSFEDLLGTAPTSMALPGWRCNRAALRTAQRLGLCYSSDTRGSHPYLPVVDGEPVRVVQLPTTLPTLGELGGRAGAEDQAVIATLLAAAGNGASSHVFTVQAGRDTGKALPLLGQVFAAWRAAGMELVSLRRLYESLDATQLPRHAVEQQPWAGYARNLAVQGAAFPGKMA
ncbi:hypothetical protein [Chitinimonas sp. BJYL2]|uniref:hypothetical protein n=1 Tax=Chitinimonas sp. BJYL2 TaxID=2976696 RepID=UPI0022B30FB0|nr:hypothetical protein [Chitinimonas sp. BJYL2]